jgi:hypothetical protein
MTFVAPVFHDDRDSLLIGTRIPARVDALDDETVPVEGLPEDAEASGFGHCCGARVHAELGEHVNEL